MSCIAGNHKPVVLVLTSYYSVVWNVKPARRARIKAVVVGSPAPQEVIGAAGDVPVYYYCPDSSSYFFDKKGPQRD